MRHRGREKRTEEPVPGVQLRSRDYLVAAACWLGAMAVYWQTLPPTVTGEDSGEFITAAYTLGIAHPPGYPLWCMLAKLFTIVLPFSTIAWRVAFMTAFFGALTCSIVCLTVIKLTANRMAGVASALALAVSLYFWKQNVVAETYSLNAFLMVLGMLLLLSWYETRQKRLLYAFAFVYGLGLCNHHTTHFMGPVFALFILSVDRRPWLQWQTYLKMAGIAALVWVSVHLYLPIRAMTNPPSNWGNPSTWEGFWDVVMRQQYVFGFSKDPRTLSRFLGQFWIFATRYTWEFTPWLACLPLFGIYPLWKRNRYALGLVLGTFFYIAIGFIVIINFNLDKESIWVNSKFWIPAYVMAAILIGSAIAWISALRFRNLSLKPVALLLSVAAFVLPLSGNYRANDKSNYYFAYDFATNILKTLEENAIYFPVADHATFPVLYMQAVEGMRPDVTIGNKYGYTEASLYEGMPFELKGRIGKIPSEKDQAMIEDWIVANTDRPVYFTRKRPIAGAPGTQMANAGLLYRAVGPRRPPPNRDYWSEYTWHTLDKADTRGEYTAEVVLSDYNFFLGRHLLETGQVEQGLDALKQALDATGESKETLNNLGSACAEYGQLEPAKEYFRKALDIDPDYTLSLLNFAKVSAQSKEFHAASQALKRIIALTPGDVEARWLLFHCMKELSRTDDALSQLQALAALTPSDAQVYREMGQLYMSQKQDARRAQQFFAKSLQLNPGQPDLLSYMGNPAATPNSPPLPEGLPADLIPIPRPPVPGVPSAPRR